MLPKRLYSVGLALCVTSVLAFSSGCRKAETDDAKRAAEQNTQMGGPPSDGASPPPAEKK